MYQFLGFKNTKIDGTDFYNVSVLYSDDNNCNYSVLRMFIIANDENKTKLNYFNKYDEIDDYIAFKVKHDGKISITLK